MGLINQSVYVVTHDTGEIEAWKYLTELCKQHELKRSAINERLKATGVTTAGRLRIHRAGVNVRAAGGVKVGAVGDSQERIMERFASVFSMAEGGCGGVV